MDKQVSPDLLRKYAEGKCTPEEVKLVESWLNDGQTFAQEHLPEDEDATLRGEIWTSVTPASRVFRPAWRLAAAAVLLIGTFLVSYRIKFRTEPQTTLVTKTIAAPKGSVKVLRLPDSSVVWLQGGASVSFVEPFGKVTRNITLLQGKAQFDVTHDASRPFVVQIGAACVEVLGTRFIVDQDSLSTQVTLTRGKVRFRDRANRTQTLSPGEQLTYSDATHDMQRAQVDTTHVTAWTRQSLLFKNTPLSEVLHEITQVYGVSCRTGSKVDGSRLLNGQFDQMPLTDVLRLLQNSTGYEFRFQNGVVHVD